MDTTDITCAPEVAVALKPFANTQFLLQKHSPEILLGAGIAGVLVSTVLACRATLKAPEALDEARAKIEIIEETYERSEALVVLGEAPVFTRKNRQTQLVRASAETIWSFTKIYAIPATLMGFSIFAICKGHGITMKRNAGLTAALGATATAYKEYRKRVAEKVGEDGERDIYYGVKEETVETVDDKGKAHKKKIKTIEAPLGGSPYAIVFDQNCSEWQGSPEINIARLRCLERFANDKLHMTGRLFLNEVFDSLGAPRTKAGQMVGWVDDGTGDGFVDFGIQRYLDFYEKNGDFYDGEDRPSSRIPLDFNVDGNVWDRM